MTYENRLGSALGHPHRAHHEGGDVIAHALLLAAGRLRDISLPLDGSAMHHGAAFPLAVMRLRLMRLVRLAPRFATMLIPPFGAIAILCDCAALRRGRLGLNGLNMFSSLTVLRARRS